MEEGCLFLDDAAWLLRHSLEASSPEGDWVMPGNKIFCMARWVKQAACSQKVTLRRSDGSSYGRNSTHNHQRERNSRHQREMMEVTGEKILSSLLRKQWKGRKLAD